MNDEVERALPAYEVGGELGRGAYGRVLWGRHRQLGRVVAIKQLDASLADDDRYRAAFLREAQVVAELSHPHVVQVYDFVDSDGLLLLVMEHLDGGSLADAYERGDVNPETACGAVMAACSGVQFVHERGVLHRDLKLENLMINAGGTLKVTDFGLARVEGDVRRTNRGDVLGTPAYMSPEQAAGGQVGQAADVYALAVTLYFLLSGQFPHAVDGGALAVLHRRLTEPPRSLSLAAPHVPDALDAVVMGGLADDVSERPANAELFALAVGAAAWDSWGPDWIARSDVDVRAPGRVLTATESPPPPAWRDSLLARSVDSTPDASSTLVTGLAPPASLVPIDLEPAAPGERSPRRWIGAGAALAAVLILGIVVLVALRSRDDPTSAATDTTVLVREPAWTFAADGEVFATAAASGANAIIGSVDGQVYALDARDGRVIWRSATAGPVRSSAAVVGDRAYVGSFDRNLYALDANTGNELWRAPTGVPIVSSPAVSGDLVVVGSGDLHAFDATTGVERWVFDTPDEIVSSPAVVGTTIVVGCNDGSVYAVDLAGKQLWRHETDGAVRSSPVVVDSTVFVGSNDGSLYALDANNGTERWRAPLGSPVNSSPAVAGNRVIVGTFGGQLVAVDAGTGAGLWRLDVQAGVDSSPLIIGDLVVVGANDRAVRGVDAISGVERWRTETTSVVLSSPALVADTIVVGSNDGTIYGIRP